MILLSRFWFETGFSSMSHDYLDNKSPSSGLNTNYTGLRPEDDASSNCVKCQKKCFTVIAKFFRIEDWESFVDLKREIIELRAKQLNPEGVICEKRAIELREEFEKRERIEREIAKLERLHVIGQLAGGLGHEVRNPMTTVRGFLQLLQNKEDLQPYRDYFDLMIEELDRTNLIINEFLKLTKSKQGEFRRQNLNELINNIFPLLQSDAFNQSKQCIFEPGDVLDLDMDANEITQLILNLVRNGLEAMSQDGCLTIKTYMDGNETVLSFKDQGTGIDQDSLGKLGTPFFTTKENGTGLGLPMCYNIADRHSARIEIETGSSGTTFFVRFPHPADNQSS